MMKTPIVFVLVMSMTTLTVAQSVVQTLIQDVVVSVGGLKQIRAMQDVEYEYTFRNMEKGIKDVSTERYIFDGEYSYAVYHVREYFALPQIEGKLIQFFDGQKTTSWMDHQILADEQPAYVGHFFRKTNYYWFNMMYKLLDPGIQFKMLAKRTVDGVDYQIVEMTFKEGVGDTSDKYVLYINPQTKLIDQFLFTVLGFGFSDPFLMKVTYEEISGLKLPTYRKYAPANWEGEVIKEEWNEQISKNIQFNNGFTPQNIAASLK